MSKEYIPYPMDNYVWRDGEYVAVDCWPIGIITLHSETLSWDKCVLWQ